MNISTSTQAQDGTPEQEKSGKSEELQVVQRLLADTNGQALEELKAKIAEGRRLVQEELNAGVGPDEFRSLTDFVAATNAAEEVIQAFWTHTHVR